MSKRLALFFTCAFLVVGCGDDSSDGNGNTPGDDNTSRPPIPDTNAPAVTDAFGEYGTVLNILPPGQDDGGGLENSELPVPLPNAQLGQIVNEVAAQTGLVPALAAEPHFMDQLETYDALVHSDPGLTDDELTPQFFKPEDMRGPNEGPWASERTVARAPYLARIKRGVEHGVPHIFGDSREDALFGAGFVTAADRLFLLDVLRRAGRGELSKLLGPADFSFDRDIAFRAPYREADRSRQIADLAEDFGALGEQVQQDLEAFVAGLNAYVQRVRNVQAVDAATTKLPIEYLALGVSLEDFTVEDVHAVATLIQAIFAGGGGGEADNLRLLHALEREVGDAGRACRLWRDIRHALDPVSSVTTTRSFDTQSPRDYDDEICPLQGDFEAEFPGNAVFDPGSFEPHAFFETAPCGRPGQPACPDPVVSGNLPQLPATAPIIELLDGLVGNLGGTLGQAEPAIQPPLRAAVRRPTHAQLSHQRLAAARQRIAALADGLAAMSRMPRPMSNALLVSAAHTASGNPIAVFGPQTSYFTPQLLLEMAVHGGDMHARGMTFAGLPYIVIGRGVDFAWSATSGGSDLTDVRVVRTCEADGRLPNSDPPPAGVPSGYLRNGRCKPFDFIRETWPARWNLAVPTDDPASIGQNVRVTRNVIRTQELGPVFAFATVDGQPVALTRQRSTYRAELDTVPPFLQATRNDVFDADSFQRVFDGATGSFNWFFVDRDDIAYFHSGLYPKRAEGVHPDLPVWGNGAFDWRGFIDFQRHPRDRNPERGYLASWNNRPARDWWAADATASRGPSDRNEILEVRLQDLVTEGNVTRSAVVEAMADAATVDLRGQEVVPGALDILEQGNLRDSEQTAVDLLRQWIDNGAMRRDRDEDGSYDAEAAVALMDAWYDPMIESVLPQIVALEDVNGENRMIMQRDNAPGPMGSAYNDGYYGYLERAFDMALERAPHPYRELRCGGAGADLEACRSALRNSLNAAIDALGGIDNRDNWNADEAGDRIQHRPLGLAGVPAIDWQNRPTFQQVVEFNRRR